MRIHQLEVDVTIPVGVKFIEVDGHKYRWRVRAAAITVWKFVEHLSWSASLTEALVDAVPTSEQVVTWIRVVEKIRGLERDEILTRAIAYERDAGSRTLFVTRADLLDSVMALARAGTAIVGPSSDAAAVSAFRAAATALGLSLSTGTLTAE